MAKRERKEEIIEVDIPEREDDVGESVGGDAAPMLPLTIEGALFFLNLMEYAAKNGAFNIEQYSQVSETHAAVVGFLVANDVLQANEGDDN